MLNRFLLMPGACLFSGVVLLSACTHRRSYSDAYVDGIGVDQIGSGHVGTEHPVVELDDPYPENIAGFDYRIGITDFRSDDWAPFDHPSSMGLTYRSRLEWEPLELEIGAAYGHEREDGTGLPLTRLRFYEIDLGLGISTPIGNRQKTGIEPYFGGGLALLIARRDVGFSGGFDHFEDADNGYYFHAGVRVYLQSRQYVAVDWRSLYDIDLDLGNGPLRGDQNTLSIGFGVSF